MSIGIMVKCDLSPCRGSFKWELIVNDLSYTCETDADVTSSQPKHPLRSQTSFVEATSLWAPSPPFPLTAAPFMHSVAFQLSRTSAAEASNAWTHIFLSHNMLLLSCSYYRVAYKCLRQRSTVESNSCIYWFSVRGQLSGMIFLKLLCIYHVVRICW